MDQSGKALPAFDEQRSAGDGLGLEAKMMLGAFMASPQRNKLLLLGFVIVAVVGATAFGQIKLNAWNQPFYNALSRKDFPAFVLELGVFGIIAGVLWVLNVAQSWLNQMMKLKLREGLTRDLLDQWLIPKRAFRLAGSGEMGVNPDQRIHEDARHLTELTTDLGIGLLQSTLLLASFIGVLWVLSKGIVIDFQGQNLSIPGYMVWLALFYAGTASWASWYIGQPLVHLDSERYAREADMRVVLVRVSEHTDGIAVYGGEADEKDRLHRELDQLLAVMRKLVGGVTRLTWVTAGYGWFTLVAPFIAAAPGFFWGDLSLGDLMMAVGAFNQVQQSLRWFVDNFSSIADWRATLLRVAGFRFALVEMDRLGQETAQIQFVTTGTDRLTFENLGIASPSGCTGLSEAHVEIKPGEHILIIGESRAGKTNLFHAIAGLWPWGLGRIGLPPAESMMFMSQRPYIPTRSLRDVLAYPSTQIAFKENDFIAALDRVGLKHLTSALDKNARWDRELSLNDQQSLAFARLFLHKPRWVFLDEAFDSLTPSTCKIVFDIFKHELAQTAVINIGRPATQNGFFTRVLHLVQLPEGERLAPCFTSSHLVRAAKPPASAIGQTLVS